MLKELDPYSVYMQGDESESVDRLSRGKYVGFGFSIGTRNDKLHITNVRQGYPAQLAGIRPGDQLCSVNFIRVDTLDLDSLRKHTRGEEGTTAILRFRPAWCSRHYDLRTHPYFDTHGKCFFDRSP